MCYSKAEGGPAFPQRIDSGNPDEGPEFYFGMSMRDYLAAHAPAFPLQCSREVLADIRSSWMSDELRADARKTVVEAMEADAELRYLWADAMLAARERTG